MKKLILVNGTMGVGKSATCRELMRILTPSVYLDGDWCWMMNPFVVNEENKRMVIHNISYMLNSFLSNANYEYVIFCWVMHDERIMTEILERLTGQVFNVTKITLLCSPEALKKRLNADIIIGLRTEDAVDRSLDRIASYKAMDTIKIDVSKISAREAAEAIYDTIQSGKH